MDSIAETLRRLSAARKGMGTGHAFRDRLHDVPAFGPNPGQLICRAYVPDGLAPGAPLVVVLHGCTQTAAAYDDGAGWSTLADEAGIALLFPQQQRTNNANLCFNWFEPGDIARDGGEAESIRSMIAHMVATHRLDSDRIHVTGLSAGGAMAAVMLATHPELFAGGAIIAGLPFASAANVQQALQAMRGEASVEVAELARRVEAASGHRGPWPRLSIWHGDEDRTVTPSNASALAAIWARVTGAGPEPTQTAQAGRHSTQSWLAPDGEVRIELHSLSGMGHGTPIDGSGGGGGRAAPFMLDVGIDSTRRIATGWAIAAPVAPEKVSPDPDMQPEKPRQAAWGPASGAAAAFSVRGPENVRHTIEGALRAAGLMR